jgi:hypothetical protein
MSKDNPTLLPILAPQQKECVLCSLYSQEPLWVYAFDTTDATIRIIPMGI